MEKIYTIPVNEAFDEALEHAGETPDTFECPFCAMYNKLEDNELELILGASMMEPDVRIKTNEQGFCPTHFKMMLGRAKRLPLALMLQSHLDEVRRMAEKGNFADKAGAALENSCYVCGRIDYKIDKMFETAALLYDIDPDFRKKLSEQKYICLPHYRRYMATAKNALSRKVYPRFAEDLNKVFFAYFDSLRDDVAWFCKKFDYRFTDEPWYNAKDSVERSVRFLSSDLHKESKNVK